jgi:ribosomal protein L12E/L44/L45/RPP1/RPP2
MAVCVSFVSPSPKSPGDTQAVGAKRNEKKEERKEEREKREKAEEDRQGTKDPLRKGHPNLCD